MATDILIPKLGFTMDEGELNQWLIEDGARVEAGQPLFLLEAEKSANEVEAPASGVLRILKPAGAMYSVGEIIGQIE